MIKLLNSFLFASQEEEVEKMQIQGEEDKQYSGRPQSRRVDDCAQFNGPIMSMETQK